MSPLLLAAPAAPELELQAMGSSPLSMMGLLAVMALVPFAIVMVTSFSKIAVVLGIARSALGTQQAPPTIVLTGLAAVLTAHIMAPTFEGMFVAGRSSWEGATEGSRVLSAALASFEPLRGFLLKHAGDDERQRFVDLARELRPPEAAGQVADSDLTVVVPAFVVTELKEAFVMGFLIFLPFLVLEMVVANLLLALGMQTLSPSSVSLPFKILLFVAVDGWGLLARGLILGYR